MHVPLAMQWADRDSMPMQHQILSCHNPMLISKPGSRILMAV
jgi:hypothetical protein